MDSYTELDSHLDEMYASSYNDDLDDAYERNNMSYEMLAYKHYAWTYIIACALHNVAHHVTVWELAHIAWHYEMWHRMCHLRNCIIHRNVPICQASLWQFGEWHIGINICD